MIFKTFPVPFLKAGRLEDVFLNWTKRFYVRTFSRDTNENISLVWRQLFLVNEQANFKS